MKVVEKLQNGVITQDDFVSSFSANHTESDGTVYVNDEYTLTPSTDVQGMVDSFEVKSSDGEIKSYDKYGKVPDNSDKDPFTLPKNIIVMRPKSSSRGSSPEEDAADDAEDAAEDIVKDIKKF